jgi:hypothetical protein
MKMTEYFVMHPLARDGKRYGAGSTIALEEADAGPLLAMKAISAEAPEAPEKKGAAPSLDARVASLEERVAALEGAKQEETAGESAAESQQKKSAK